MAASYKKGGPLFPDPRNISDKKAREGAGLVHTNPQRAFQLFHQASEYGHPGANFECGAFYERGIRDYLEPDLKEAARHYMLASFGGLPHARYNLAFLYERGAGVLKKSTDRCLQLLDAAAEAGHGGAASALAERLFRGVIRDRATEVEDFPEEAIYYWLLAAKEGMPRAAMALSVVFAEGIVINEPDYDLSARFVDLALMLWWISIKDTDKASSASLTSQTEPAATKSSDQPATSPKKQGASQRKKTDRVLRLPSYFNRCGAAALVRERVLNRLLTKSALTVEEVLEKAKSKSGGRGRGGLSASLQGPSPAGAMLEWLESIKAVDQIDKDKEKNKHGDLSGDELDDPEGWERRVVAIGPRFTFRNPEVSMVVLRDFKRLGFLDASFDRPVLIAKKKEDGEGGGGAGGTIDSDYSGDSSKKRLTKDGQGSFMFNPQQRLGTLAEN